jgi:MFS family permease
VQPETGPLFGVADFRRLFAIGIAASMGRWIEMLVIGVAVWAETGSAFLVASMTLLRMMPMGLFGTFAGVAADRVQRRSALVAVLLLQGVVAVALCVLATIGTIAVWHIALGSFLSGISWAADNPVRRMMLGEVVGGPRMGRAMSFDVMGNNACRIAGPALGGLLLAQAGLAVAFAASACVYMIGAALALAIRHRSTVRPARPGGVLAESFASFAEVLRMPGMKGLMTVTITFNVWGWPALSMVPVIAEANHGLGPGGTGLLASMDGLGALACATCLAWVGRTRDYRAIYVAGTATTLVMLMAFALAPSPGLAGLALTLLGIGSAAFGVTQSTLVYLAAPGELRSRALGVLSFCIGLGLVGFLHVGIMANLLGAPTAMLVIGAEGLLVLILVRRRWPALG